MQDFISVELNTDCQAVSWHHHQRVGKGTRVPGLASLAHPGTNNARLDLLPLSHQRSMLVSTDLRRRIIAASGLTRGPRRRS